MRQIWHILSRNSPESLSGIETGVKSIDYKLFGVQPFQSECDRELGNVDKIGPVNRFNRCQRKDFSQLAFVLLEGWITSEVLGEFPDRVPFAVHLD